MSGKPLVIVLDAPTFDAPTIEGRRFTASTALADYWALTKPEINFLIAIATFAGFYLGRPSGPHGFPLLLLVHTLFGTLLVASGTGTLNQYLERRFDAQMRRTARRPLAAGRMEPSSALWFGIALTRWATFHWNCSRNCCGSCRSTNLKGWAARARSRWTCA